MAIKMPEIMPSIVEKAIIFLASLIARSQSPSPSRWPMRMEIVVPIEKYRTEKVLKATLEMFIAETVAIPRRE